MGGSSDGESVTPERRPGVKRTYRRPSNAGTMLHEERTDVSGTTPGELLASYEAELAAIVEERGVDAVADETGVDPETLRALVDGESPTLDLEDAAAVEALDLDRSATDVYVEACEHLLLGMSMAVLDVDVLAGEVDADLSGKEIQQKLERRSSMTLAEFAELEHAIASGRR